MKLKVCGMKYEDNILNVAELRPDYLGFIFYEKSPRFLETSFPKISNDIKKIGVFVNASIDYVLEIVLQYDLQAVQLHGTETSKYCKLLRDTLLKTSPSTIEIVKVFTINDVFNFDILKPYEELCDYYLFDTKGKLPGGNGYTFNWNLLKNYPSTKPYFLSGGIGPDEIKNIKSFLKRQESKYCHALDVNSKFEIKPGLKNIDQLKIFKDKLNFYN
jgi:phosphoribosylanthranilate isomerase